jgi:hypothetical protein
MSIKMMKFDGNDPAPEPKIYVSDPVNEGGTSTNSAIAEVQIFSFLQGQIHPF